MKYSDNTGILKKSKKIMVLKKFLNHIFHTSHHHCIIVRVYFLHNIAKSLENFITCNKLSNNYFFLNEQQKSLQNPSVIYETKLCFNKIGITNNARLPKAAQLFQGRTNLFELGQF